MKKLFKKVADGQVSSAIRLADDSTYEAGKCTDGGHYGDWRVFELVTDGWWQVTYGTTCSFGMCTRCGRDVSHGEWDNHYCGDEFISASSLFELLCSVDWDEKARYFDGKAFTLFDEVAREVIF